MDVCYVLHKDNYGVDVLVIDVLNALLVNFVTFGGAVRYGDGGVLHAYLKDLKEGL